MTGNIFNWLNKYYPQNYIIRKPLVGSFVVALFSFFFLLLYQPLGSHGTRGMSYEATMAVYCSAIAVSVFAILLILKNFRYFSDTENWTFSRELISVIVIPGLLGTVIFLFGFIIEPPSDRWNIETFVDSVLSAFLIGLLPFLFFTTLNYRYLFYRGFEPGFSGHAGSGAIRIPEEKVHINSSLKKESLSFYPGELLFAESDGNYVVFYLKKDDKVRKEIIRNSINSIEKQLLSVPFFLRTHRAFIVNLNMISGKQGSSSGYILKLKGTDLKVPVSRQNCKVFDKRFRQFNTGNR